MLQSRLLQAPEPMQHLAFAHPFAHRPLVEFMLGIPPSVVCRPGEPRRLQRRAFADLLPPRVLNRRSKAAFTDAYVRALIPLAQAMLRNPDGIQIVERRFVDRQSLLSRLERFTQGLECNQFQLRNVILYEFWLRTRGVAPRQAAA
jgi:asparagine synthase (glutamine-hydrolysing)